MYLPEHLPNAKILITVKTYPRPTPAHEEIVCSAGLLETGEWIRIYPIPFRDLPYEKQFKKFTWIELDLVKETSDFRKESYKPKCMYDEEITIQGHLETKNNWLERRRIVLQHVFTSMGNLIKLAYSEDKSLATLKPSEIVGFNVEEEKTRGWDARYTERMKQMKLFETGERRIVKKLPYSYYYRFLTEGDTKPRRLMIHDWEIGALYWNCVAQTNGDEDAANELVKKKYFEEFTEKKELYFFLGTTYQQHKKKAPNPFSIIGVFAPPQTAQLSLPL